MVHGRAPLLARGKSCASSAHVSFRGRYQGLSGLTGVVAGPTLLTQNGHWGVQTGGDSPAVVLKRLKAHFIFRYWSRAKAASGERYIWNPRAVQRLLSQLLVDVSLDPGFGHAGAQDRSLSMLHRKRCRCYEGYAIADDAVDMVAFRPIKRVSLL